MNTHKIVLMNYQDKLESVAMTNTESLSQEQITCLFTTGGHLLIPISSMDSYLEEAKTYTTAVKHLYKKFKNKSVTEAEDYCKQQNLQYSIVTD